MQNELEIMQFLYSKLLDYSKTNNIEIPVIAAITDEHNEIITIKFNEKECLTNPIAHAEILAIEEACRIKKSSNLTNCTLYSSLEPCWMCSGAILTSKISRVVFGSYDEKGGGGGGGNVDLLRSPFSLSKPEVIGGILEGKFGEILTSFFERLR